MSGKLQGSNYCRGTEWKRNCTLHIENYVNANIHTRHETKKGGRCSDYTTLCILYMRHAYHNACSAKDVRCPPTTPVTPKCKVTKSYMLVVSSAPLKTLTTAMLILLLGARNMVVLGWSFLQEAPLPRNSVSAQFYSIFIAK